jgi:hypothetical protein
MTMGSEQIFHEGDRAIYGNGRNDVEVEVIEERGPIGVGGRHLVMVRMQVTCSDPVELEIAEARLRPVTTLPNQPGSPE